MGGNDTVTGNGNTRVSYDNATAGVMVTLGVNGSGTATGDDSVGTDTFVSGVSRVHGSDFADTITGNGGNNFIEGQGGSGAAVAVAVFNNGFVLNNTDTHLI